MTSRKPRGNSHAPTMRDVAKLAGVSQPTVSRVLNKTATAIPVSEETRAKVLAAVKELGYRPNMTARSLRTQRTQMIALLVADITNGFYHPIARAVQDVARQHDYDVLIANSDHRYEDERHFCEAVMRRAVDGVIMVPIHLTYDDLDRFLTRTGMPVVALGQHVDHPLVDVVYADDETAMYECTRWLVEERGYRKLGYLGVPDQFPPGPRRWSGFKKAADDLSIEINPQHVLQGDFSIESGRRAARQLLAGGSFPSVLVATNDLMAIGAILALQDAGCTVPDDIAVMGFDDIAEATIIRPNLTTVAQDPLDIGRKLATGLFERIDGKVDGPRRMFESACRLIPRQSA